MVLICVAAILCIAAFNGMKKGAIRMAASLVAMIITIAVTTFASPIVSEKVKNDTDMDERITQSIYENIIKDGRKYGEDDSQVIDSNGRVLLDNTTPTTHTVLKASTASLLTQGMTSVITEGTGTSAKLDGKMPVSGKTGTTSSEYDLWFCGYTPYLTASIWTGYDENVSLSGDQAYHERLWAKIMNQIDSVKKYKAKSFKMSKDVKKYDICSSSGKVAIKGVCPTSKSEYFAKGTQPAKCTYHSAFSKKSSSYSNSSSSSGSYSSSGSSSSSSSGNSKSGSNSSKSSSSRTDSGSSRTSKSSSGSSSSKGSGKTVGK